MPHDVRRLDTELVKNAGHIGDRVGQRVRGYL
jgi:hypothetical protein